MKSEINYFILFNKKKERIKFYYLMLIRTIKV